VSSINDAQLPNASKAAKKKSVQTNNKIKNNQLLQTGKAVRRWLIHLPHVLQIPISTLDLQEEVQLQDSTSLLNHSSGVFTNVPGKVRYRAATKPVSDSECKIA
jgi:hypothetical protein